MTACCPNCGFELPPHLASKGGGNPALPPEVRKAGQSTGEVAIRIGPDLIGWRGMVWAAALARKEAACWITGATISVSAPAWRPITNGRDRPRRVADASWVQVGLT